MGLDLQSMLVTSGFLGMWCQFTLGGSTGSWFHSGTAGKFLLQLPKLQCLILILSPSQTASRHFLVVLSPQMGLCILCPVEQQYFSKCLPRDASTSNTETSSAPRFLNKNSGPVVLWPLVFQCKDPLRICCGGAHPAVPSFQTNH